MPKILKIHDINGIKLQEIRRDKCTGCCFNSNDPAGCTMPERIAERLGSLCVEEDIIFKNITKP